MTRLAMYEENQGKEDFKISAYYRRDYTSMHVLSSVIWVSVGYACAVVLAVLAGMETLLGKMSNSLAVILGVAILIGYLVLVILYAVITRHMYNHKHRKARHRVKKYNHDLTILLKMYKKENR